MGDWNADTLSNDPAQDYLIDVIKSTRPWELLGSCLRKAGRMVRDDELDRCALAAAEIVAASLGRAASNLGREYQLFAATAPERVVADLTPVAISAVRRVRDHSDLRLLVDEGGPPDAEAWLNSVDDLLKRLGYPRGT